MKLLKSIVAFFFTLCASQMSQAQVEGVVLDSKTGVPIEYVNVFVKNQQRGTLTDSLGTFQLYLKSNSDSGDTITFSRIGYEDQELPIIVFGKAISLVAKPEMSKAVVITGNEPRDTLVGFIEQDLDGTRIHGFLNSFSINNRNWFNNFGVELALRIDIPNSINYAKIKNIGFYFPEIGKPKTPFRLKLYKVENESGAPSDYLIEENLILKSKMKKGWFEVNLEDYDIFVDSSGFYISMEWLGNSKRKYWSNKDLSKAGFISEETKRRGKTPLFGQVLGMYDSVTARTASRFSFKHWQSNIISRHPMIRATLSIAE